VFGAAEPEVYKQGLLSIIPQSRRQRVGQALDAIGYNLRWWLVGQFTLMVTLAVTTAVALWLIGIPMALALGMLTGILEMLPYIGAWLSAVPAALVALLLGPWDLVMVLGLYLGVHILEAYLLAALIQRRAVHLLPALTLVGQIPLGEVAGVLGLFVAAPRTVVAVVAVKMLYVEDALGDESLRAPGREGQHTSSAA
jgi:predicted PurR-regulated permease PerM